MIYTFSFFYPSLWVVLLVGLPVLLAAEFFVVIAIIILYMLRPNIRNDRIAIPGQRRSRFRDRDLNNVVNIAFVSSQKISPSPFFIYILLYDTIDPSCSRLGRLYPRHWRREYVMVNGIIYNGIAYVLENIDVRPDQYGLDSEAHILRPEPRRLAQRGTTILSEFRPVEPLRYVRSDLMSQRIRVWK